MFHSPATSSTPPTPIRKKLELLPRSGDLSTVGSPIASPLLVSSTSKSNPFGAAKYVPMYQIMLTHLIAYFFFITKTCGRLREGERSRRSFGTRA